MEDVWLSWSVDQLLWATRGRSWGFRILTPATATGLNPLSVYEAVFDALDASSPVQASEAQFVRAVMVDAYGADSWVIAARFLDPDTTCCDESGRRIPHEILLVGKMNTAPDPRTGPADWHLQVFRRLAPLYRELYQLKSSDRIVVPEESIGPSEILREISAKAAVWIDVGTILRNKRSDCCVALQGVRAVCEWGRRRALVFLVLMTAAALFIAVTVLIARKPLRHSGGGELGTKPQQKTMEPSAGGLPSPTGAVTIPQHKVGASLSGEPPVAKGNHSRAEGHQ